MADRNGPEFAPLREFNKSCLIEVVIYNTKDEEIRREEMDYGKPEDRSWLGKLSFWAWQNGHVVETYKKA